jgi:nucleoid-associated protein
MEADLNDIVALAIHDLVRGDEGFEVRLSGKQLPVRKTTQRVVDELYDLYNGRASKSHGKFTAADGYPTEGHIKEYVEAKKTDFVALTSKMMTTLERQARQKAASQGGHVFFAHFRREGRDYLLVTIVNDKLGATLTGDLEMEDVNHLDLDGFRFAGRINLTGWVGEEERYISFLKGKGTVSEYFKEFLGCDSVVQDRKDTADLVLALKEFTVSEKMAESDAVEFLAKAKSICERNSRDREELEFDVLANELMPRNPKRLVAHLAHVDRALSDGFVPDRRALRSLVRLKTKTDAWTVEFDREALNRGPVRFNAKDNSLTLFDLPADFAAELRALDVQNV